jgi:HEAT repeat protein
MEQPTQASSQAGNATTGEDTISDLIQVFKKNNGRERQAAREKLCEIGHPAVPALIQALNHPEDQVRWEAAKSLTMIPDPRAADALVNSLKDSFSIRWLASEALINIGEAALVPLLRGLIANPDYPRLRESAHHVLTGLKRTHPDNPHITEMLSALSGQAQTETVPWVAREILRQMGLIPHA